MPGSSVERTSISHTGTTYGAEHVTLGQNQPDKMSTVCTWEHSRQYEGTEMVGKRDATRFVPRTRQKLTGTAADDTVVVLDSDIMPVAGKHDLDKQDYPAVIAMNATTDTEIAIDAIDYGTNEVTLADDPADGDEVYLYPILAEGSVQFRARNSIGQVEGAVYKWPIPIYRFHDFPQLARGTEINLHGSVTFEEHDELEFRIDSPHQLWWEDNYFPQGQYISSLEQQVELTY
ncbi:hypothetical protein ZOD2009_19123 [Haladaptatus paucihalophilus DX253]|uniref:Uncharacterized protein n=1 Tax=Haladaptatus paucihalophilus DX253 TaxID=797209 RepID=E7QYD4_HALPU|nr:hypothetical protein [Haladaptatus paucihalophilus]EFW90459.1 hypothetical protein ZOD2009_19123 [Haladaptatus paucihalophilus DX253]SHL68064.1 hypothetical protein SAMN05444342_4393 [Haladaptatus paucihalophilus DX253]